MHKVKDFVIWSLSLVIFSIFSISLLGITNIPPMLGLLLLWAKFGILENVKRKGIMIGTIILLFNMVFNLEIAFFIFILLGPISFMLTIAIFILSYYFTGKYSRIHWPEPLHKWAIWLAIPWVSIIVISVVDLILGFMGIMNMGRGAGGIIFIFIPIIAFIAYKVAFSASYKGANDGYKIVYRVPPLGEKRELSGIFTV